MNDSKCPWCGVEQTELFDLDLGDGDTHETQCQDCEKDITIVCCYSVDYEIKSRNCKPHNLTLGLYHNKSVGDFVNMVCIECKFECYHWHLPGDEYAKLNKGEFTINDTVRKELERINFNGLDQL